MQSKHAVSGMLIHFLLRCHCWSRPPRYILAQLTLQAICMLKGRESLVIVSSSGCGGQLCSEQVDLMLCKRFALLSIWPPLGVVSARHQSDVPFSEAASELDAHWQDMNHICWKNCSLGQAKALHKFNILLQTIPT